jgi:hypothetical protein
MCLAGTGVFAAYASPATLSSRTPQITYLPVRGHEFQRNRDVGDPLAITAFESSESALQRDFNGDGDRSDHGVFYYQRATNSVHFVDAGVPEWTSVNVKGSSGDYILIEVGEHALGEDYNGDGTVGDDDIPGVFNVATGELTFLRVPPLRYIFDQDGVQLEISGSRVLMEFRDAPRIGVYDLTTDTLTTVPVGSAPGIGGDIIASARLGTLLSYYNMATQETVDTDVQLTAGERFATLYLTVTGNWITFLNDEVELGEDLNGDGRLSTAAGIYSIKDDEVWYPPIPGIVPLVDGDRLYYWHQETINDEDLNGDGDTTDTLFGYLDLATRTPHLFEVATRFDPLAAAGDTVAVMVWESQVNEDLNGDGYISVLPVPAFVTLPSSDVTKPTISINAPTATTYLLNQHVTADHACQDEDGGSGIASCDGSVPDGRRIGTRTVGAKTFWVRAADEAGNLRRKQVRFTVAYDVCTSFDQSRQYESSRTLTIAFQLCDANGKNVSSAAVPVEIVGLTTGPLPAGTAFRYTTNNGPVGMYAARLPLHDLAPGEYTLSFTAGNDPTVHTLTIRVIDGTTPNR